MHAGSVGGHSIAGWRASLTEVNGQSEGLTTPSLWWNQWPCVYNQSVSIQVEGHRL